MSAKSVARDGDANGGQPSTSDICNGKIEAIPLVLVGYSLEGNGKGICRENGANWPVDWI